MGDYIKAGKHQIFSQNTIFFKQADYKMTVGAVC